MMVSKQTVEYECRVRLATGNRSYWRREMIVVDSWHAETPHWGAWRPVMQRTYESARRSGYRCREIVDRTPLAEIIPFGRRYGGRRGVGSDAGRG